MFKRIIGMAKRLEMATDAMVLEKSPDSAQAAKIRAKYEMKAADQAIRNTLNDDVGRISAKIKAEK